jgi:hypothetical protein
VLKLQRSGATAVAPVVGDDGSLMVLTVSAS